MTRRLWAIAGLTALAAGACVFLLVLFLGGARPEGSEHASAGRPSGAGQGGPLREAEKASGGPEKTASGSSSTEVRKAVARFKDSGVPLKERRAEIEALARKGDARSVAVLMALGDEKAYLNRFAVEALGGVRPSSPAQRSRVADYLRAKLAEGDALVLCAAIRGLARLLGEAAVPELTAVIKKNRVRADGHEDMVCTSAVRALKDLASARAAPALVAELGRSEEKGWSLEYGSELLAALGRIGTPGARAAAAAYADRLAARVPHDPLARQHVEAKVKEARAAAQGR